MIYKICEKILPSNLFWILDNNLLNEKILIVECESKGLEEIKVVFEEVHKQLCELYDSVTSNICEKSIEFNEIQRIISEMRRQLQQNVVIGESKFYYSNQIQNHSLNISDYVSEETKKELIVLFKKNYKEQFKANVTKILGNMYKSHCPQIFIEEYMKTILRVILPELNMNDSLFIHYDIVNEILSVSQNFEELQDNFEEMINDFFEMNMARFYENLPQNQMVQEVKLYIENHYRESINIQIIAAQYGIVAPYLSKLYFDYYDISIKKYILELRLIKAEELLRIVPPLPLREIAELTGFNDPFYFSKIFKKERLLAPVDFRKYVNEEQEE